MNIYEKLLNIQKEIKVNKTQYNKFSNFYYRNVEDILTELKPLAHKNKCLILLNDYPELIGDYYYIRAVAELVDTESNERITTQALAREPREKKSFDEPQITGTASSYARKYALNGMLALDDNQDVDSMDNRAIGTNRLVKTTKPQIQTQPKAVEVKNKEKTYSKEQIEEFKNHLANLTLKKYEELSEENKNKANEMMSAVIGKKLTQKQITDILSKKETTKKEEPKAEETKK